MKLFKPNFKKEEFFSDWKNCAKSAVKCCEESMTPENICPTHKFPCPAIWDGFSCFNPAEAGRVVEQICPAYLPIDLVCSTRKQNFIILFFALIIYYIISFLALIIKFIILVFCPYNLFYYFIFCPHN